MVRRSHLVNIIILVIIIITTNTIITIIIFVKPVQFVEVEDGQENTKQVDQDPDCVQHIVTVRSLRPRFRSYFLMSVIIRERKYM